MPVRARKTSLIFGRGEKCACFFLFKHSKFQREGGDLEKFLEVPAEVRGSSSTRRNWSNTANRDPGNFRGGNCTTGPAIINHGGFCQPREKISDLMRTADPSLPLYSQSACPSLQVGRFAKSNVTFLLFSACPPIPRKRI